MDMLTHIRELEAAEEAALRDSRQSPTATAISSLSGHAQNPKSVALVPIPLETRLRLLTEYLERMQSHPATRHWPTQDIAKQLRPVAQCLTTEQDLTRLAVTLAEIGEYASALLGFAGEGQP